MSIFALLAATAGVGTPVDPEPEPGPMWALGSPGDDVYVPAGSLDRWLAARDASATTHADVLMLGDSVTWGQQSEATTKSPTAYLLREQALADGYLDGGDGITGIQLDHLGVRPMMAPNDPAQATYQASTLDSGAFITSPSQAPFEAPTMTAAGSYTIRGWGTRVDVIYRPFGNWLGTFTYSVDGGPEVEVVQVSDGSAYKQITAATGLTPGIHEVTVTNKGGRTTTRQPTQVHKVTGGTLPAGTYYYRTSLHDAVKGESPTSDPLAVTVTAGQKPRIWLDTNLGGTMRVYRSTGDATGPYGLVGSGTPSTGGGQVYLDIDDSITPGAAPTSPSWFWGGDAQTMVNARFTDPARGLAWFRAGGRGTSSPAWASMLPNWLSVTTNPKLVVASWGINDAQVGTADTQGETEAMIDAARAAGADVIVAVPPLRSRPYEDQIRTALRAAATAKGAAVVEYAAALGPKETWSSAGYFNGSDVHPTALGYRTMAAWLWDNLLSLGPDD